MAPHKPLVWLTALALLTSCTGELDLENTTPPTETTQPETPVPAQPEPQQPAQPSPELPQIASNYFLLDFKNGSSTNLSGASLATASYYENGSGLSFSFDVPVTELSYPGIYSTTLTLTNTSGQAINLNDFPIDNAQLLINDFEAQDEASNALVGGAISNANGFKAESNTPFLWITRDEQISEIPEFEEAAKRTLTPNSSISRVIDISLPQDATQVVIAVALLAESVASNNIPVASNGFSTALVGKYAVDASVDGFAQQARLSKPSAVETCGSYLHIIENNSGIFRRYSQNKVETTDASFRVSNALGGMDCYKGLSDQLVLADTGSKQIYISSSFSPAGISEVIGSGEEGSQDGEANSASFTSPTDVAALGKSIIVADGTALRLITETNRRFSVTTLLSNLEGTVKSVTSDAIKTVYYTLESDNDALSGLYAFDLETLDNRLIWQQAKLSAVRHDGAAGFFVMADTKLMHVSQGANGWQATLAAGSDTPMSVGSGLLASETYLGNAGFFDVDQGTVYIATSEQQVLRIDRLR